jgi:hypothetical protein
MVQPPLLQTRREPRSVCDLQSFTQIPHPPQVWLCFASWVARVPTALELALFCMTGRAGARGFPDAVPACEDVCFTGRDQTRRSYHLRLMIDDSPFDCDFRCRVGSPTHALRSRLSSVLVTRQRPENRFTRYCMYTKRAAEICQKKNVPTQGYELLFCKNERGSCRNSIQPQSTPRGAEDTHYPQIDPIDADSELKTVNG